MSKTVVRGEIVFDGRPELPPDAVIRIKLRDTSEADAGAAVVAERVIEGSAREANERGRVNFELPVELRDARASYSLSAHVDLGGNGRFEKGDYINMQSYPVSAANPPQEVSVQVKRIKL